MRRAPSGAAIEIFDTIDSTNREALRRASGGPVSPQWIIARRQSAGYGRRGSQWLQQEGDLAATLLFTPDVPAERFAEYSFIGGLAVADALLRHAPRAPFSLKWPNDVLVSGAKIAGLLFELTGPPAAAPALAFGMGVNIVSAPQGVDYPTARLADLVDPPPAATQLAETIDEIFAFWRARHAEEGFARIRTEWLARADRLGETIRVRLHDRVIEGVFQNLDSTGALILDCPEGRQTIAAGAVMRPAGR